MLIAMILMGLLAYLIYSLKIIYSIAWSLEEVVTELVVPISNQYCLRIAFCCGLCSAGCFNVG